MLSNKYNEPTPSNRPEKSKTTQVIIIAGILLGLLVLLNVVIYLRGGEKLKAAQAEAQEQSVAMEDLKKEKEAAIASLDSLRALFPARELEIEQLKQKIEEQDAIIRRGINSGGKSLAEARRQIDELSKANATLEEQLRERDGRIAQLQSDNDRLMEEIRTISTDLSTARARIEELERNGSGSVSKPAPVDDSGNGGGDIAKPPVDQNKAFSVSGVFLKPKEVSKKDKTGQLDRDTKNASKTSRFQVSFTVEPTDGVAMGPHKFHIQLIDPSQTTMGTLIGQDRASGQEYRYTFEKEFNYSGTSDQVMIKYDTDGVMAGDYMVNIWHNGMKIGSASCKLKK